MKFIFKKPPKPAIYCYSIGFTVIAFAVLHQFLAWQWLSIARNQQVFIFGAIIVAIGSLLNWILPFFDKRQS